MLECPPLRCATDGQLCRDGPASLEAESTAINAALARLHLVREPGADANVVLSFDMQPRPAGA